MMTEAYGKRPSPQPASTRETTEYGKQLCAWACAMMCTYLCSIGVAQDVASHYVDEVGLRVDFTHEATESFPESEQRQKATLNMGHFSSSKNHIVWDFRQMYDFMKSVHWGFAFQNFCHILLIQHQYMFYCFFKIFF